ncbi:MAG: VOC family protein [Pelagibacterium sp.]|jgi:catechol 2,3-dioxygenase-like lactoylglutathione lyase family enzyme|uniref:VOC family protein n=1 Tax=Pelagibacterium sp. TaxID=1967288 RepID=UPI0032EB44F1
MPIMRVERLLYGVDDIAECARFFADAGFVLVAAEEDRAELATQENQRIILRHKDDPRLPKAVEDGSTLRELWWGVEKSADLKQIVEAIGPAAEYVEEKQIVRAVDPNGLSLRFEVSKPTPAEVTKRTSNQLRNIGRVNERLEAYGQGRPLRIVHVAYNITKAKNEESLAFYTGPLKFKAVDKVLDTGTFLQSEGDIEHHNFFLCFRPDKAGINHIALEVRDFDEVMEAGNHMITQGWKESRRPGRHTLGSNVYRFVHNPAGGRIEYVADMDRMDKSWETRVFEKNPGHNIWMLKSSGSDTGEN